MIKEIEFKSKNQILEGGYLSKPRTVYIHIDSDYKDNDEVDDRFDEDERVVKKYVLMEKI